MKDTGLTHSDLMWKGGIHNVVKTTKNLADGWLLFIRYREKLEQEYISISEQANQVNLINKELHQKYWDELNQYKILLQKWETSRTKFDKPEEPPRPTYLKSLSQGPNSLYGAWFLSGKLFNYPAFTPHSGMPGEESLWDELHGISLVTGEQGKENGRWFISLTNLPIAKALDADILVLSNDGIWLFESKYWQGIIDFNGVRWMHSRDFSKGRKRVIEELPSVEPPDQEWLRIRKEVETLLSQKKIPLPPIHGGVVFTHPNVKLQVHKGPVICDALHWWKDYISTEWEKDSEETLSPLQAYKIIDALLDTAYSSGWLAGSRQSASDFVLEKYKEISKQIDDFSRDK